MTSEIGLRRRDIDRRERLARELLLKDHQEKFAAEYAKLREDCAKTGHVLGRYWDNGLGWTWKICAYCGASYDHQSMIQEGCDDR